MTNPKQELNLHEIARELKRAQDDSFQIHSITSRYFDFNLAQAYEVAHLIHKQRVEDGSLPVGRKIGFTNFNMWETYGVREPVWAYMYGKTVTQLSSQHAECFMGGYCEPKIEPEIVFHFSSTPPVDGTLSELLKCIDWIALGFEIVQSHFPGWEFQAADTVADRGLHAELFIGEPQAVNRFGENLIKDLERFEVELSCGSEILEVGYGKTVLGSPLKALQHLISVLNNQDGVAPLQAGEIVTTGTLTSAFAVEPGQNWKASLNGMLLPGLSISFDL